MENYLIEQYQSHHLPHALLLETDAFTATTLVNELITSLSLTAADYYSLPSEETIKVAQIREAIHFASLSSMGNNPKFISIADATKLTIEAANAFLKTLEEPPSNTYFILAARQLDAILPTIRSRCRLVTIQSRQSAQITAPLPFPQSSLQAYFSLSKDLAAGDTPLLALLQQWLQQLATLPANQTNARYQSLILRYMELAQNNPNKRLFLDNLFLEAYNSGEDSKELS